VVLAGNINSVSFFAGLDDHGVCDAAADTMNKPYFFKRKKKKRNIPIIIFLFSNRRRPRDIDMKTAYSLCLSFT
jgi:hypothetical protein